MSIAEPVVGTILCRRCFARVELADRFCRHCGLAVSGELSDEAAAHPAATIAHVRWSDRRWFVITMLFFVLGPLAIPMLWSSRSFSHNTKWVLSVLCVLATFLALFASLLPVQYLFAPLRQAIPHSEALFGR